MDRQQRFERGELATVLVTLPVDAQWPATGRRGAPEPMLDLRLPDGRLLTVPVNHPDIKVIHGDIRPTLEQMAADAIAYHYDGTCGIGADEGWVCQYEQLADAAGLVLPAPDPLLTGAPPLPDPG